MRTLFGRAAVLGMVLIPSAAHAELLRVEFKLPGMDCAYCNGAMSASVRKIDGVETVELVAETSTTVIKLKAGNKVTLAQLRRVIKSVGYDAKDATVNARGRFTDSATKFDLLTGTVLPLASPPANPSAAIVEVSGTVKTDKDVDSLTISSVR